MNISKLKGVMAEKGDRQIDLAKYLGVAINTMRNKLSGKTEFKVDELQKIAHRYNKPLEYFFEN